MRTFLVVCLAALVTGNGCLAVEKKPLQLSDVLKWARIQAAVISNDGEWLAYKSVPNEGDAEVIVTHLADGKETRFGIGYIVRPNPYLRGGEPPNEGSARSTDLVFSEDSKWVAFSVHPDKKELATLKKAHKPAEDKAVLLQLSNGSKTEFQRIKRFSFSGERAGEIALLRYGANPPVDPPAAKAEEKPQGSDLILVDLATSAQLSIGNVSEFAFNKTGEWLAWLVDAQDHLGNAVNVRNLKTGMVMVLDSASAVYKQLNWTEKGDALAALRGVEDKRWEDKLYSVVAFRDFSPAAPPARFTFEAEKDGPLPAAMGVSPDRRPTWAADLSLVTFGIHDLKPKEPKKPEDEATEKADLVIWNWKDPRLQSMQKVQEQRDKAFSYLCSWVPAQQAFHRLGDESVRDISLAPDARFATGNDVREYQLAGNLDGKQFSDVYRIDPRSGERKLLLTKARWVMSPSPDGRHLLYYTEGNFLVADLATGETRNLTKDLPVSFVNTEDDYNVVKPPTRPLGWSKDSRFVLLSDNWDIWKIGLENSAPAVNLTGNGKKEKIRYSNIWRLDPDEKGFDLEKPLFVRMQAEWTKKSGIGRIDADKTGVTVIKWEDAVFAELLKAKKADVFLYTRESLQDAPNYYRATGADLAGAQRVTEMNAQQKDFAWTSGRKLVEYIGPKGDRLQGVVYLPANYQEGKKYPAILYLYEKLSQNANSYAMPGFNGFSIGYYTSNGYAVITPDITYKVNDPGISSIACVTAALKAAIATGVIDETHVGMHGHSWGGYQTAFAVTQTKAFRAAIAGAPLTDMVSMYSSIYWNTGSANQPIFESSQGRFQGSYLEQQEAYLRNSPVFHANQVQTPLLILHNDKDGAVDFNQGIEYFNTLRRLSKPVVMLEYLGENHGLFKPENMIDYTIRQKEFWDYFLMEKAPPKWWSEGVPMLKRADQVKVLSTQ